MIRICIEKCNKKEEKNLAPRQDWNPQQKKCMVVQRAQNVGVQIFAKCHSYNETSLVTTSLTMK